MKFKRIKDLREDKDLSQEEVAKISKRYSSTSWNFSTILFRI